MEFRRWRIDASKGHGGKTDDGQRLEGQDMIPMERGL